MIALRKIKFEAKKKRNENYEFRIYLKGNADEKELDEQFHRLHKELFSGYDCSRCRNCCKMYHGSIPEADLARDAEHMGLTKEQFIEKYLTEEMRKTDTRQKMYPVISWEQTEAASWASAGRKAVRNIRIQISRTDGRAFTVCWM